MAEQQAEPTWAIVEVMGHSRFAGRVSEAQFVGCPFIRVDVPELPATLHYPQRPSFTKYLGAASIFAITPCTQEAARRAAEEFRSRPCDLVDVTTPRQLEFVDPLEDDESDCAGTDHSKARVSLVGRRIIVEAGDNIHANEPCVRLPSGCYQVIADNDDGYVVVVDEWGSSRYGMFLSDVLRLMNREVNDG